MQVAWRRDVYRALYLEHGWPSNFDGDAFDKARIAWDQEKRANYRASSPIRGLGMLEATHKKDQGVVVRFKADVIEIDKIEANATKPPMWWDPKKKTLNFRTREQLVDAIESVSKRITEDELRIVELRRKVDEVDAKVKEELAEVTKKYGGYWDL